MRMRHLSLLCLAVLSANGCKTTSGRSAVKVVNGTADDQSFPATVALAALNANDDLLLYCTGTFIRDDLLVTAAHCTQGAGTNKFVVFSNHEPWSKERPTSSQYTAHQDFSMDEPSPRPADLAFILFPKNTAPANMIATLAGEDEQASDGPVTMVGYGGATPNWQWDVLGVRRIGKNQIAGLWYGGPYRMIKVNTDSEFTPADASSINEGDSGGPLYNAKGNLIGIGQSGKYLEDKKYWDSRFIDLLVPRIANFVKSQLEGEKLAVDVAGQKPFVPASGNKNSNKYCLDNNGQGYGQVTDCSTGKCAKLGADLKVTCTVSPNWGGRAYCSKNAGRGYGPVFDCNGLRCAKVSKDDNKECVLLAFISAD
jgi:hypothetical protein